MGLPFNEQEQEVPRNLKWQNKNILYRRKFRKIYKQRFPASRQNRVDRVDSTEFELNSYFATYFRSRRLKVEQQRRITQCVKDGTVTARLI